MIVKRCLALLVLPALSVLLSANGVLAEPFFQTLLNGDMAVLKRSLAGSPSLVNMPQVGPYEHGARLLHYAVKSGNVAKAEFLLRRGAHPNVVGTINYRPAGVTYTMGESAPITPLELAVVQQDVEMARLLVRFKANVNAGAKPGRSPFRTAVEMCGEAESMSNSPKGSLDMVNALLPTAKLNEPRKPILVSALPRCSPDDTCRVNLPLLDRLLVAGAKPSAADGNGDTAAHILLARLPNGYMPALRLLVRMNANVSAPDGYGYTPLHYLVNHAVDPYRPFGGNGIAALNALIKGGARVNAQTNAGETPLYLACKNGQFDTVRYLVGKGAKVNLAAKDGTTPLDMCVSRNDTEAIRYLKAHGAVMQ